MIHPSSLTRGPAENKPWRPVAETRLTPVRLSFDEYASKILHPAISILKQQFINPITQLILDLSDFPQDRASYTKEIILTRDLMAVNAIKDITFSMSIRTNVRFGFEFFIRTEYGGLLIDETSRISDPNMRTSRDMCEIFDNYVAFNSRIRVAIGSSIYIPRNRCEMNRGKTLDAIADKFTIGLQMAFASSSRRYNMQLLGTIEKN